jgi:hypothetical protein
MPDDTPTSVDDLADVNDGLTLLTSYIRDKRQIPPQDAARVYAAIENMRRLADNYERDLRYVELGGEAAPVGK